MRCALQVASLKSIAAVAGFLGPALDLGLSLAGVEDATQKLIKAEFAKVNQKLDYLEQEIRASTDTVSHAA